jgi:hypothetical protein
VPAKRRPPRAPRPPSPKVGDAVECLFLDHCEDGDAMPCTVWGRLVARTRTTYKIASWVADGEPHNEKTWSIVRKAVTSLKTLHGL